jgi:hypothetical protein
MRLDGAGSPRSPQPQRSECDKNTKQGGGSARDMESAASLEAGDRRGRQTDGSGRILSRRRNRNANHAANYAPLTPQLPELQQKHGCMMAEAGSRVLPCYATLLSEKAARHNGHRHPRGSN